MVVETILYHYECSECGYFWRFSEKLEKANCPKCLDFKKYSDKIDYKDLYKSFYESKTFSNIPKNCVNCSNHPSNGGSGVCHCILGLQTFY